MTWNNRVIRKVYENESQLGIHEVFYNDEGIPYLVTVNAVGVVGDTLEELEQSLKWMLKALGEPILEYSDFEEGEKYYSEDVFGLKDWDDGTD